MNTPRHPAQIEARLRTLAPLQAAAEALGDLAPLFACIDSSDDDAKIVRSAAAALSEEILETACADYDRGDAGNSQDADG